MPSSLLNLEAPEAFTLREESLGWESLVETSLQEAAQTSGVGTPLLFVVCVEGRS